VSLENSHLEDEISGTEYPIAGLGTEVLDQLIEGDSVDQVATAIAEKYHEPADKVASDVATFIGELDSQALISTRQSYWVNIRAFIQTLAVAAPSPAALLMLDTSTLVQPTRRYPPNLLFVLAACLEAQGMLIGVASVLISATVTVKVVAAWREHADPLAVGIFAGARPFLALAIFALLFICHEAGHLLALRALHMKVRSVGARMWVVGITYVPGSQFEMLLVSAAGPLMAFGSALVLAILVTALSPNAYGTGSLEVSYIILFGLLHLWSLRPWAGDGRQLAGAILALSRGRRRARGTA
jgi:hypothetical protein